MHQNGFSESYSKASAQESVIPVCLGCVFRGVDALYASKSRGFGGEIGLVAANTPLVP